jgi:hypothetical protein
MSTAKRSGIQVAAQAFRLRRPLNIENIINTGNATNSSTQLHNVCFSLNFSKYSVNFTISNFS